MPMDWLATLTTVALIWLAGPFVLAAIWIRSWPAHDEWMTTIAGLCLALAFYAGHTSWLRMTRGIEPASRLRANLREARHVVATALTVVAIPLVLVLGVVKTELRAVPDPDDRPGQRLRFDLSPGWQALWGNGGEGLAGLPPLAREAASGAWAIASSTDWASHLSTARLAEVQFSALPPEQNDPAAARHRYRAEWCARNDLSATVCGGSTIAGDDALAAFETARGAWCAERGYPEGNCAARFGELNQALENEWSAYRNALIEGIDKPDLRSADLRGADLASANLTGAQLSRARIDGANLQDAQMERADLREAQMERAGLRRAQLHRAVLWHAQLGGADLGEAKMEGANLGLAQLEGAGLRQARMEGRFSGWRK
jgi:hypothetical protein